MQLILEVHALSVWPQLHGLVTSATCRLTRDLLTSFDICTLYISLHHFTLLTPSFGHLRTPEARPHAVTFLAKQLIEVDLTGYLPI